jgi:ankyrin repeat protein
MVYYYSPGGSEQGANVFRNTLGEEFYIFVSLRVCVGRVHSRVPFSATSHHLTTILCGPACVSLHPDSVTMPLPELPLELLLMIAHHIRKPHGELRYGDFNSFLQVNRALYASLNRMLWKEAAKDDVITRRVFTHLIDTNNLAGLEFFLELGPDIEDCLPGFTMSYLNSDEPELVPTPLLAVADLDNVPMARLLIEKGAKVQYFDQYGRGKFSPLHFARSAEMVELLVLDHYADPNLVDDFGYAPIHFCTIANDIDALRALLEYGADGNLFLPSHGTALHQAAQCSLDAVEILVFYMADVEVRDVQFNTPLHLAAKAGKTDVVKFLVEEWPEGMRATNCFHATPLHLAAEAGRTDVVDFLVEQWPKGMKQGDFRRNTPLHLAAKAGKTDVVKLLVEKWPRGMRAKNDHNAKPLHLAAEAGRTDVVDFLVEQWPEGMRERDFRGNTPLHCAAEARMTGVVRLLADRWPEGKEELNYKGQTPWLRFQEDSKFKEDEEGEEEEEEEEEEEMLALLGGPYSEANND